MLSTVFDSARLLFAGKLFKENRKAIRQVAIAAVAGALTLAVLMMFAPLWLAAIVGGAVAGGLQPILFKDLKYA